MSNLLRCVLRLMPHPYPEAPGADQEVWGELVLSWQADVAPVTLLKTQWDLLPLAEWFADNQEDLCHETWSPDDPEWASHPGESLTLALQRCQGRLFGAEEQGVEQRWPEKVFAFRQRHSLRFALRGAQVPGILIGCNHGAGEVSGSGDAHWSYKFAMEVFCWETRLALHQFLTEWLAESATNPIHQRVESVLVRLEKIMIGCC